MDRVHDHPGLIYPVGTQVVSRVPIVTHEGHVIYPRGAVGVIVHSPLDHEHSYRVRFPDGYESPLKRVELTILSQHKEGSISDSSLNELHYNLSDRVIYRCVIGSQAYGLAGEDSDIDLRGIYLPTGDLHWSLYSVPEQLENDATQETYWELQKFLILALKSNPNVLECLFSPLVEFKTPLAEELIEMRGVFVSQLVYQTYNGYVLSQFKKMQTSIRNQGEIRWKHVMHLIRLLLAGIEVLKTGLVPVHVGENRDSLLAIRRGEMNWEQVDQWRLQLHKDFNSAYENTTLPERPDYERANQFLIKARRLAATQNDLP